MRGKDTHIRMHDAKFYFVKESFDEVQQLINAGPVGTKFSPEILNFNQPSEAQRLDSYQTQKQQVL
jgi:hypothetical protein